MSEFYLVDIGDMKITTLYQKAVLEKIMTKRDGHFISMPQLQHIFLEKYIRYKDRRRFKKKIGAAGGIVANILVKNGVLESFTTNTYRVVNIEKLLKNRRKYFPKIMSEKL